MRRSLQTAAILLGGVGIVACLAAIIFGWYAAANTTNRIERAANRLDHGLSAVDAPLARVELKVTAVHAQLNGVRTAAVAIAAENPALPRVKEAIDQLVARLISGVEQAETLADSLRAQAAGIRAAAEFVEHFHVDENVTRPLHAAADKIDHAADALDGLRGQVEELKVAKAIDLTNKVLSIAGKALAGTDALATGVSSAREGLLHAREQAVEVQEQAGFWIYLAAAANTILWLWGGLGQLALIGWGRRDRCPMQKSVSHVRTYEELRAYLRHMIAFDKNDDEHDMYDVNGIAYLMLALARNLNENANEALLADWARIESDERDRAFFARLGRGVQEDEQD